MHYLARVDVMPYRIPFLIRPSVANGIMRPDRPGPIDAPL